MQILPIQLVPTTNSNANQSPAFTPPRNAFPMTRSATRLPIVQMVPMNLCIAESTNVPVFKTMDVITNVLTPKKASSVNVILVTSSWLMARLAKTSMNVLNKQEHVRNNVSTLKEDILANVIKDTINENLMVAHANVKMTLTLGLSLVTSTTFATLPLMLEQ